MNRPESINTHATISDKLKFFLEPYENGNVQTTFYNSRGRTNILSIAQQNNDKDNIQSPYFWKNNREWEGIAGFVLSKNDGFFKSALNLININRRGSYNM